MKQKCIIYTRVSSVQQVTNGSGLSSQEQRCRSHARQNGWQVEKVFTDGAVSGGLLERPGIQKMLEHLAQQKQDYIVLADDISRFARDNLVFALLKKTIGDLNGQMQTVNLHMEDSPESDLIQSIMSSAAAYERQKNRLQVIARIRARIEQGYWVFRVPPLGYRYKHIQGRGKVACPDGVDSEVVRKTLEALAKGELISQTEVAEFATKAGLTDKKGRRKDATLNLVKRMVERSWFYAGFVEYSPWGITRRKGQHEPLISIETYNAIQDNYKPRKHALNRSLTKQKFYLRGMTFCAKCDKRFYGCHVSGRNSKYAYYYCSNRNCSEYSKSYRLEAFHDQFSQFLSTLKPSEDALDALYQYVQKIHDKSLKSQEESYEKLSKQLLKLEQEENTLIDKLSATTSKGVETALCRRIEVLEINKARLNEKLERGNSIASTEVTPMQDIAKVCNFFRNLEKCWETCGYEGKRAILNGLFDNEVLYSSKNGFRNRANPLVDWLKELNSEMKTHMVEAGGVEPPSEKVLRKATTCLFCV